MSSIQLTPIEVHGKTLGICTTHGALGFRVKYTQAKELYTLEVWRTLWKLGKLYTVQEHSNRKCLGLISAVFPCHQFGFHFDRPNAKVCLTMLSDCSHPLFLVHLLIFLLSGAEVNFQNSGSNGWQPKLNKYT